jgi:hypothetical protein
MFKQSEARWQLLPIVLRQVSQLGLRTPPVSVLTRFLSLTLFLRGELQQEIAQS